MAALGSWNVDSSENTVESDSGRLMSSLLGALRTWSSCIEGLQGTMGCIVCAPLNILPSSSRKLLVTDEGVGGDCWILWVRTGRNETGFH